VRLGSGADLGAAAPAGVHRQINGSWQFDPNPDKASEIEARFTAAGPQESVVQVEHRGFERLDGGQAIQQAINGGGGWKLLLDGFATVMAGR
jgi:hypothetical protein